MLKLVKHDKLRELRKAKRFTADTIRSLRDDKVRGWMMAGGLLGDRSRALPSVEMIRRRVK